MTSPETLFLIDGSNNVYRSYFAIRGLANSSGLATNAVYGFTQTLRKLLKDYKPDAAAVAFDIPGEKIRTRQFEDYKKDRRPMPDDLSVQMPLVYEVLEAFGLPILTIPQFEADDLLGSLACQARDLGYEVVIATSDKDFFQIVGNGIRLYHTGREVLYDAASVTETFGVAPDKVADVMALWGDAIDNIPGVPGIGEKTAKALISEFGSLDHLYANLDKVKKPAQRQKLEQHRDKAFLSRELATIKCDLDVQVDFKSLKMRAPDRGRLHDLFARLEFHSLLQEYLPEPEDVPIDYRVMQSAAELRDALKGGSPLAIHFQPEFEEEFGPPAVAALSLRDHQAFIVPLARHLGSSDEMTALVKSLLTDSHNLVAHDMKAELRRLNAAGWPAPRNFDDTMIMSYVLHPGAYGHELETLSRERLKRDVMSWKALLKCAPALNLDKPCLDYVGEKTDVTMALLGLVGPELKRSPELEKIYRSIELPLIPVLARMEDRGIKIDVSFLKRMSDRMAKQLAELETRIYADAGQEFNINSPSQLGFILFEKLQYPVLKKTVKTKSYSTGVEVLTELAGYGYSVPQLILEHRELHKLRSTYVDALPQLIGHDGRVHTSFNQAVAATGRLSSSNPNLQNIPIRTEQGREIRRAFIAEQGNVLLSADYSQIELRVLAHVTGDPGLIEGFTRGGADIHRSTASKMFNVPESEVTANQRRAAKVINFGVLYGMSAFRVSNELQISTGEAKDFIDNYFGRYPKIQEYLDRILQEARSTGKVSTMFGRIRQIPEIHNRSFTVRSNAERMATNAPIQGAAADLMKLAMVALDERLQKEVPDAGMLLTVHDEIVIEAPEKNAAAVAEVVKSTMQSIHPMAVPLEVETHWGKSWFEAKE